MPRAGSIESALDDRQQRISDVIRQLLDQSDLGISPSWRDIEQRHVDLQPELGDALRTVRSILAARESAQRRASSDSAEGAARSDAGREIELLQESLPQYQILEKIRLGGQGSVYRAIQRGSHRVVALKLLLDGPLTTERRRRRFEREIELIGRLEHPNIVRLYESGVVHHRLYFSMEHVEGLSIDDYAIAYDLPVDQRIELIRQVCEAVSYAHQRGIIHRDLNPSNILVDLEGKVRVLDFGLAKELGDSQLPAGSLATTSPGGIVGTLPFLSPEQAAGQPEDVDVRTDVYAIGVLMFVLLTGRHPYDLPAGEMDARRTIMSVDPLSMRRARGANSDIRIDGEIDGDLEAIVARALAKRKDERYQSVSGLMDDLERRRNGEAIDARRNQTYYVLRKTLRRYRTPLILSSVLVGLISMSAVGMGVLWRRAELTARDANASLTLAGILRASDVVRGDGRLGQAEQLLRDSITVGMGFETRDPRVLRLRAATMEQLARIVDMRDDRHEAYSLLDRSQEILDKLAADAPDDADIQRRRASVLAARAGFQMSDLKWAECRNSLERVRRILAVVLRSDPNNRLVIGEYADSLGRLSAVYFALGNNAASAARYSDALDILTSLLAAGPEDAHVLLALARMEINRASTIDQFGFGEHDRELKAALSAAEDYLSRVPPIARETYSRLEYADHVRGAACLRDRVRERE